MTKLALAAVAALTLAAPAAARAAAPAAPTFVPPYMLEEITKRGNPDQRQRALRQLQRDQAAPSAAEGGPASPQAALLPRGIYDARHTYTLPGVIAWRGPPAALPSDPEVRQGATGQAAVIRFWQFFGPVTLAVPETVHVGQGYDNAFWNGTEMVFGDGDGVVFKPFTCCLDIVGHERMHGITGNRLAFHGQSGALNESVSDVFGSLVMQFAKHQTVAQASWLLGQGQFEPGIHARAYRDMLHPGTAYDDPLLGKDPQPATMAGYVHTSKDNGGVHYNSGIPNRAFALSALALGGHAWDRAGRIWYAALTSSYSPQIGFADFANITVAKARSLYGADVAGQVTQAWRTVGVLHAGAQQVAAE